jgi:3-demethoxyubiquinol 3-hydroxylase
MYNNIRYSGNLSQFRARSFAYRIRSFLSTITENDENDDKIDLTVIPKWLQIELRTNQAGEYGACQIYYGAIGGLKLRHRCKTLIGYDTNNMTLKKALDFLKEHMKNEEKHLILMNELTQFPGSRTNMLPLWHVLAVSTGWIPAFFGGRRAIYCTISSVETFVEEHYQVQINRLKSKHSEQSTCPSLIKLTTILEECCADEVEHKNEAQNALLDQGYAQVTKEARGIMGLWMTLVEIGSKIAVSVSRVI